MDPQSLNRYVYAMDNPLTILDSTGHAGNPLGTGVTAKPNASPTSGALNSWWDSLSPGQQHAIILTAGIVAVGVATLLTIGLFTAPVGSLFVGVFVGANTEAGGAILGTVATIGLDTATSQNTTPAGVGEDMATTGGSNFLQGLMNKYDLPDRFTRTDYIAGLPRT